MIGRSKNGAFKHVLERAWNKVCGLKGQGLSKAGKEILIKSVLQAVPAYTMSCFAFTKSLCKQLRSIMARFWWGANKGQRKVHWVSWERMTLPKKLGGVGFRELEAFNQAMLARQGWRLLTVPNSLCARVLKARYYRHSSFLQATSFPKNASYTWRSILHGRELLKKRAHMENCGWKEC